MSNIKFIIMFTISGHLCLFWLRLIQFRAFYALSLQTLNNISPLPIIISPNPFTSCFPTKLSMYSTFPTYVLHPTPLAPLLTWSTWYYLVASTNYKVFRYAFFSIHVLFFLPLLGQNTFISNGISDTLNVSSFVRTWDQILHPYKTKKKI